MYYLFIPIKCILSIYIFMKNMGGLKNKHVYQHIYYYLLLCSVLSLAVMFDSDLSSCK